MWDAPSMTFEERISWILRNRPFANKADLARRAGISPWTLGKVLKGENNISKGSAELLSRVAEVRLDWLMFGEGSPEPDNKAPTLPPPRVEPFAADTLEAARGAVQTLLDDGVPESRALEVVGALYLQQPNRDGLAFYRAAREKLTKSTR